MRPPRYEDSKRYKAAYEQWEIQWLMQRQEEHDEQAVQAERERLGEKYGYDPAHIILRGPIGSEKFVLGGPYAALSEPDQL